MATSRGQQLQTVSWLLLIATITSPILLSHRSHAYDSASSCDPRISRKGRSQLLKTIPCDLSIQAYCNLPGSAYPWHAVRRFVHENQGLMRRMYGDVRHISVLKEEFENNEIDIDDIDRATERYSRMNSGKRMKYLHSPHYEYVRDKSNDVVLSEPHFRPTQKTTPASKPSYVTVPSSHATEPSVSAAIGASSVAATGSTVTAEATTMTTTSVAASGDDDVTTLTPGSTIPARDDNNTLSNNIQADAEHTEDEPSAIDMAKLSTIAKLETSEAVKNGSTGAVEIVAEAEKISSTLKLSMPLPLVQDSSTVRSDIETTIASSNDRLDVDIGSAVGDDAVTVASPVDDDDLPDASGKTSGDSSTSTGSGQKIRFEAIKSSPPKKSAEGQLFQDAAQKEQPVVNMKGVNACPVKEEVVAPFWANNTRGEVLALLNLYPFEQYVHWEKCTHEHKQMYCREGCRCEQQYRLHRLLAYDPHNECRGIFSDWFRFPSCCICKCYDIPFDFRVTSRSPRSLTKESIEYIEDELQNAIYEHATDDWYRPKESEHH